MIQPMEIAVSLFAHRVDPKFSPQHDIYRTTLADVIRSPWMIHKINHPYELQKLKPIIFEMVKVVWGWFEMTSEFI